MKLEKIHIDGFGKLTDFSLDLHPQFNLVFGPNEAGKSTLQQVILHLLYGFYHSRRATPQENALWERFQPWQSEKYGGRLWYVLADGRRYQVDRNFTDSDIPTHLFDSLTGEDVTNRFNIKRHGNIPFLKEQLGMAEEVFESTVFVRQAEVKAIAGSVQLVNEIIGVLDSGAREKSAAQTIAHLQNEIARIGTDRAQKRKLPQARLRLHRIKEEYEAQLLAREELKQTIIEKNRLEQQIERENIRRIELNYHITTKEIERREKQLNHLKTAKQGTAALGTDTEEFSVVESIPDEVWSTVVRRQQYRKNYREQIDEKKKNIKEINARIAEIDKEIGSMRKYESIYSLMPYTYFLNLSEEWRHRNKTFVRAQQEVDQQELALLQDGVEPKSLQKLNDLKPSDFDKFNRQEEALKRVEGTGQEFQGRLDLLESQTWATAKNRKWIIGGTALITLFMLLFSYFFRFDFGYPVSAGFFLIGFIVFLFYRKARERISLQANELQKKLLENRREYEAIYFDLMKNFRRFGIDSLNKLLARRLQNEHYLRLIHERDSAFKERDRVDFQLLKYLQSVNVKKIDGETLERVDEEYHHFSLIYSKIVSLKQEKEQSEKSITALHEKIAESEKILREQFERINIDTADLSAAETEFSELLQKREALNNIRQNREKLQSEIRGILSLQSEEEILKDLETLMRRREQLLVKYPQVQGKRSSKAIGRLENTFLEIDQARQEHEKQVQAMQARIDTMLGQFRPRAEVEEELAQTQAETDRLLEMRTQLKLAKEVLSEVALNYHRSVVPFLNSFLSKAIDKITDKRYSDVKVNPDGLSLNLVLPEKGSYGSSDFLSFGTQEQLYLLLRVALTRLLSQTMESLPLILDDPFVHFDHTRMANMMHFLVSLSKQNQVLLFTKEPFILDWCTNNLSKEDYLSVHLPALPVDA